MRIYMYFDQATKCFNFTFLPLWLGCPSSPVILEISILKTQSIKPSFHSTWAPAPLFSIQVCGLKDHMQNLASHFHLQCLVLVSSVFRSYHHDWIWDHNANREIMCDVILQTAMQYIGWTRATVMRHGVYEKLFMFMFIVVVYEEIENLPGSPFSPFISVILINIISFTKSDYHNLR